jgi:PAS domain S-box-containing protein
MFSKEAPARLFLSFLVLVLVLVNAQSLQLSSHSRELLTASFEEAFELRARVLADELSSAGEGREASVATELLAERAPAHRFRSACVLDWDGRLLTGGSCDPARGEAFDRLDHQQKRRLVEEGWAMAAISSPYEVEKAEASGYVALRRDSDGEGSYAVLRVVMPAPSIAEANRRFRATLIYQVSGLSLVLLAILLFFHSLVAPHRRLVAEARSVATELSPDGGAPVNDEAQFLLETFQEVVARLKQKEQELLALHRLEKTRADETEALASDIIRSMTTGLVSLDPSGHVVVVNPAAERIFGIDTSNARGRLFHEVFPGSEELGRMVDEALLRGAYQLRGQTRYGLGEGRILHLGVSVIPLLSPQETPKGALCLVADLTEVVELRERVFLKENLARLGETAAGIAHEFRNGLATILGNARLLKGSNPSSEPIVEALVAESQSLARIVSELLQFARPEPLRLETFDLKALVYELLEELRPRATAAGVLLSLEGDAVGLDADETLIRKALSNLVVNALEALEEIEESGRVDVEVREASGLALVRVRDNGPGIDAPHRAKIFTPFFTLKEKGTGLGLSVVQKIVVTHNGTVELEETPSGASFVVKLPLRGPASFESEDWL